MIIPFYDNKGEMYYFQGRSIYGEEPKYKNPIGYPKYKGVYNIFNVDKSKEIILCEGPLDSLFLPNAIAVTGSSIPHEIESALKGKDVLYLWDNDEAGQKNAITYLNRGCKVFLWKKFITQNGYPQVKDINELLLKIGKDKFELEDIKPYFSNFVFDGVYV